MNGKLIIYLSVSLRAQFATDDPDINCVHGAQTEVEAEKEIQFFFPKEQTVAVIKPDALDKKGSNNN